ncbi:MAG: hypothetical protein KZQ99_22910 [Candidatus Thiodiazotropha sp. (ex Dulcina madagascariensis)]|nr:hypothetical protein [Candidatus Thiodiazotropha sp. (ex Dulcina madagascariensis)]
MGNPKIDDEYRVSIKKPGEPSAHQLTARVSRIGEDGCGLSFDGLRQHECLFLSELTNPRWDGKDLLEGVIIHGVLENTTEFASCMRLTSLLSGGYLRASRANQQTRQEPSGR